MGGGGGSGAQIGSPYGKGGGNRSPDKEWPFVNRGYGNQIDQFNQFIAGNPLLSAANTGALDFWKNLPSLTGPLQSLQQQTPGFFSGLQNEISGIQGQVPGLQNQLQGIFGGLGGLLGQIPGLQQQFQQGYGALGQQTQGLLNSLPNANRLTDPLRGSLNDYTRNIQNVYNPIVASGGKLTDQQSRDVAQQTRSIAAAQGNAHTTGALGTELLNRDTAKDQRLALYSGLMNNAAGTQSGLAGQIQNIIGSDTGLRSGLLGQQGQFLGANAAAQQGLLGLGGQLYGQQGQNVQQQSGLLGLLSALTGQKGGLFGQQVSNTTGLSSAQQGLQTGGLNQLLGASGAGTSQFSQLTNPILSYVSSLFGGNQQTQIAQAQINQQAQQAGDAKTAGGVSAGGSIISAIIPIIAGL